ncbi:MAG: NAD-dependent epimerase/dehydratase family protein [Candidatus Taylorbacteria bacterium]|nr:NAD-dependent epimerase/dehydratase family protein [Candidatus Taylorbacteria bacterium]
MQAKKKILVTGGAGFVGSNLIEQLVKDQGNEVYSLDNYSTGSKDNHIAGATYLEGNTADISTLVTVRPDLVFHLGEYARVEKSFEDIEKVWRSNKDGTFAVLEFCRAHKAKLVYAGSSTKFGDGGLGRDQSPYAWSKASNTELVKNYGVWFGLTYAITYFYNVYGPRELGNAYGTVIEIFRQRRLRGEPLEVVAPGTQMRMFTHVDDIVRGLLLVGEKGVGDGYGLGSEEMYSIMDIAKLFGGEVTLLPERAGNRMTSSIDLSRSSGELGWKAEKGVKKYIEGSIASSAHTHES